MKHLYGDILTTRQGDLPLGGRACACATDREQQVREDGWSDVGTRKKRDVWNDHFPNLLPHGYERDGQSIAMVSTCEVRSEVRC